MPQLTQAFWVVPSQTLFVFFDTNLSSVPTLTPGEWTVRLGTGTDYTDPTTAIIQGGSTLRLSGWTTSPGFAATDTFEKTGSTPIDFVGGGTITTIPQTGLPFP